MNILVTGGCGFIGQHLVERLALNPRTASIWVLDALDKTATGKARVSEIAKLVIGNVCEPNDVNTAIVSAYSNGTPIDLVMHLAAQSHVDESLKDSSGTMYVNAVGTQVVATACSYHKIPLLYCSTDEVYGPSVIFENGTTEKKGEGDVLYPSSPYSAGKAAGELAIRAEGRSFGLQFAITRGCNSFGPNQFPEKLIPIACQALQSNKKVPLHGGGSQIRQWVHVSEFADTLIAVGFKLVSGALQHDTYNIAGPTSATVKDLVENLACTLIKTKNLPAPNTPAWKAVGDRPGQDEAYHVCGDRFFKEFGWRPKRNILDEYELSALLQSYKNIESVYVSNYTVTPIA